MSKYNGWESPSKFLNNSDFTFLQILYSDLWSITFAICEALCIKNIISKFESVNIYLRTNSSYSLLLWQSWWNILREIPATASLSHVTHHREQGVTSDNTYCDTTCSCISFPIHVATKPGIIHFREKYNKTSLN